MRKTRRSLSRVLVEARLKRGWTQQQVADLVGTHPSTINRWEQGKTSPGPLFREKLKQLFGWNEQELGPSFPDTSHHAVQSVPIDPVMPLLPQRSIARKEQLAALKRFLFRVNTTGRD